MPGDWCVRVPGVEPSGWSFEFENDLYPDVDDTAVVLLGLHKRRRARRERRAQRALAWVLAMQSENGGWAAFDKDNTSQPARVIPFADFGEMIDPPSADVTAHVVEMLGVLGLDRSHPAIARALAYLYAQQEPDGSWFGRWGVNHIYGIGAVLPALAAVGRADGRAAVRRAVRWLAEHQNHDGGFGEGCESYVDPKARGRGPSTPSQTAWALLGARRGRSRRLADRAPRGARTSSTPTARRRGVGRDRRTPAAASRATASASRDGARIRQGTRARAPAS